MSLLEIPRPLATSGRTAGSSYTVAFSFLSARRWTKRGRPPCFRLLSSRGHRAANWHGPRSLQSIGDGTPRGRGSLHGQAISHGHQGAASTRSAGTDVGPCPRAGRVDEGPGRYGALGHEVFGYPREVVGGHRAAGRAARGAPESGRR